MSKAWYSKTKKTGSKHPHVCYWTIPDADSAKGIKQCQASFATQAEALEAVLKMQARIDRGEFDRKPLTFGEAAERWLKYRNLKPATLEAYHQVLRGPLAKYVDMPLREVAQMRREMSDLVYSHKAGRSIKVILAGACDLAMADGDIEGHRLGMLPRPRRVRRARALVKHDAKELNAILAEIPERYRIGILLARGCGLRVSEFSAMQTDAIHDGWLEVKRACTKGYDGTPKQRYEGFTPRRVPIPLWLQPLIDEHIEKYAKDGVFFPRTRNGYPRKIYTDSPPSRYLSYRTLNLWFKKGVKAAGLPDGFTFHQLRKGYATQLRDEANDLGIDWGDIEEWLGHKNLTRDVYAFQGSEAIERGRKLSDPRKDDENKR
jgi:integrase